MPDRVKFIPKPVIDELSLSMSLLCFLSVDLTRPWATSLVATDGAECYGFGMAKATCTEDVSRAVAAHSRLDGHGIIPAGSDQGAPSVAAVEKPLYLDVHKDEFVPQFSVRAKIPGNAPEMEAGALTLAWRRLTRSPRNHSKRWVCLVDSLALMHAARKGRSSSGAFRVQLQKIASLALCADVSMTYAYIPTASNPADGPSRGVKRKLKHLKRPQPLHCSWSQHCQSVRRALRHLRASSVPGVPSDVGSKSSFNSLSSDSLTVQPYF